MEQVNIGIIGTGLAWERLHYPAYQELSQQYRISAICDQNPQRAEEWGQRLGLDLDRDVYIDYHAMLRRKDLQVIDIMVPIPKNHPIAEEAARAMKSVILEKPLGATLDQAIATEELPRKYGIRMMIAENYRYSEEYNIIRSLLRERRIGEPVFFVCHSTSCFPCSMTKDTFSATEWRQHPNYPGGDIMDAAIHDLAGLRHLFGAIQHLQAYGVPQKDDFSPYAAVTVNISFASRVIGTFSYYPAGREVQRPLVGLRIFGTRGMIYLEEPQCGVINVFYNDGGQEQIGFRPNRGYYNELLNFYNALTGKEEIGVPPEMELGDLRTVTAILQSIVEEEVVRVDKIAQYAAR